MPFPTTLEMYETTLATWPAKSTYDVEGWRIRDGAAGGKRASAATWEGSGAPDLTVMEHENEKLGQHRLVMVRAGEDALDQQLEDAGYTIIDPVTMYAGPIDIFTAQKPDVAMSYAIWEPLQVMTDIWTAGGIGEGRIDLMHRCALPKTGIMARTGDIAAATGFGAIYQDNLMLHAIEVLAEHRGKGLAKRILNHAGHWAQDRGAKYMTLVTTRANEAANGLYTSLGMQDVGHYHYRIKT